MQKGKGRFMLTRIAGFKKIEREASFFCFQLEGFKSL